MTRNKFDTLVVPGGGEPGQLLTGLQQEISGHPELAARCVRTG